MIWKGRSGPPTTGQVKRSEGVSESRRSADYLNLLRGLRQLLQTGPRAVQRFRLGSTENASRY